MENFAIGISYGLGTAAFVYAIRLLVMAVYRALREV